MKLRIIAILLLTTQSSYIFLNPHSPSSEYTNYLRMFHQYSRCLRTPTGISQCLFNPGCWTGDTHAIITTTIPPHPRQTSLMDHLRPGPRCGLKSSLSAGFLGTATHQSEVVYKIKTCFATVVQVQPSIFEETKAGLGGSITQRRTSTKPGIGTGLLRANPRLHPRPPLGPAARESPPWSIRWRPRTQNEF